jgi:hypothetical protein
MPKSTASYSVTSNVKGGVDITLARHSLILGASGSGKSAIVNAIELAATGRLGDYLGREDVAVKASLAAYTSDGTPPTAACSLPSIELPYRALKEAIRGSPETFWRYVLQREEDQLLKKVLANAKREVADIETAHSVLGSFSGSCALSAPQTERLREMLKEAQHEQLTAKQRFEDASKVDDAELQSFINAWSLCSARYIPESLGVPVLLGSCDPYTLRIGLAMPRSTPRFALSGAEFNIVLAALAITQTPRTETTTRVVIPDDRAISSLLLSAWLTKLSTAPCHLIVTSTVRPAPGAWESDWATHVMAPHVSS